MVKSSLWLIKSLHAFIHFSYCISCKWDLCQGHVNTISHSAVLLPTELESIEWKRPFQVYWFSFIQTHLFVLLHACIWELLHGVALTLKHLFNIRIYIKTGTGIRIAENLLSIQFYMCDTRAWISFSCHKTLPTARYDSLFSCIKAATFHPPSTWRAQSQGSCPSPPKRERDVVKVMILLSKDSLTLRKLNIPLLLCTETLVFG